MTDKLRRVNELIDKEHAKRAVGVKPNFLSALVKARRQYRTELKSQKHPVRFTGGRHE